MEKTFQRSLKSLDNHDEECLQCCIQRLICNSGVILEDNNADKNADSKKCVHEVSNRTEDSIAN